MTLPIRSILALSILVVVLAACGTAVGAPGSEAPSPSQPAAPAEPTADPTVEPSDAPSAPEAPADEEREVHGTITVAEGMAYSGPGGSIQEALDNGPSGEFPTLVNGVLFRDTDGEMYLATSVSDVATPTFDGPILLVVGIDSDGPEFDTANADLLGLEEANGIVFRQNAQILGFLELP